MAFENPTHQKDNAMVFTSSYTCRLRLLTKEKETKAGVPTRLEKKRKENNFKRSTSH